MGGMLGDNEMLGSIPIVGNLFGSPAAKANQQNMFDTSKQYARYRPEVQQAHLNAMRSQLQTLQPANNALAAMYGQGQAPAMSVQSPFGESAKQVGQLKGHTGNEGLLKKFIF